MKSLAQIAKKALDMTGIEVNMIDINGLQNPDEIPDAIEEIEAQIEEEYAKKKEKNWWVTNLNGTRSLKHEVLAVYVLKKRTIVRYPDAHGELYFYNEETGLYERDKTGRQVRSFIRDEDELKSNQVREVHDYIVDMSPVIATLSTNYIAVNNGLIHLKTLAFRKFTPDEFLTSKIPTNYKTDAYDEFVDDTLNRVTNGYEPSRKNLEEMFGCILYPKVLAPKMFYLYGKTAHNGKSSILYLTHKTFNYHGGNISAISPQKLASNTFAGSSMYGKLANVVDDQPDEIITDSGTLKSVITGGYVDIEQKGKDSQTVEMTTVLITASNSYPNFKEHGNQINRRLHIIPFEHNFSNDTECLTESESMERLSSDSAREYVLKLAVDAVKRMLATNGVDKLTPNEKAERAKEDFAEYSDPLTDFFFEFNKECFEEVKGTDALQAYDKWCHDNHISHPLGPKRFKDAVCSRYGMEWKAKSVKINGVWKTVKGFKSK